MHPEPVAAGSGFFYADNSGQENYRSLSCPLPLAIAKPIYGSGDGRANIGAWIVAETAVGTGHAVRSR